MPLENPNGSQRVSRGSLGVPGWSLTQTLFSSVVQIIAGTTVSAPLASKLSFHSGPDVGTANEGTRKTTCQVQVGYLCVTLINSTRTLQRHLLLGKEKRRKA